VLRVVFDTSVLVSVALTPKGVPAQAYEAWRALRFSLFTTQAIIHEVRTTLGYARIRRRYDCAEAADGMMRALHEKAMFVSGTAEVNVYVRDPKDYMILSAAAEAEAHVLVSSDQDLLVLGSYEGTMILTPRQFLTWLNEFEPEEP
jgi:putative PIN family toxin of toxin-antitoxin system